ncbi:anti-sigma-D factor RsdA [Rhodococcus sp. NPDC003318]|uniref:anti-sigma-D factor RsdA n=1 Tax=Rhodococcus sp. NPDC003318 TaxID=3364503 RepID=UPI0036BA3C4D
MAHDEPVDLAAVQRDDALIDAIAGGDEVATSTSEEYQLAMLLAGWRAEIVAADLPAGPTLDEVAAAVDAELAQQRSSRSFGLRLLRPVAGAAAAIAVVMAGVTVFSYNAEPGDPLWKVKEVVFSERASSTVASIDTTSNLEEAERLIRSGDPQGAMAVLDSASRSVTGVNDASKRDELNAWHDRLMSDVAKTTTTVPPTTTDSPRATTTVPGIPGAATTVPGTLAPVVPSVPPSILQLPVVPTLPSTTRVPVVPLSPTTVVPPAPVTSVPQLPEVPTWPDTGSGPTTLVVPTQTLPTADLVPSGTGAETGAGTGAGTGTDGTPTG